MAFTALTTAETDAKSPVDDGVFLKIKDNFDDLNSRVVIAGAAPFPFEIYGRLSKLANYKRSLCYGLVNKEFTPSLCRYMLKRSGLSGNLTFDIRKHTSPKTPITGIDYQYAGASQSVGRVGTSLNTQSIARSSGQIATQSITFAKAAPNVQSIVGLGLNLWLYNLSAALDADNLAGDQIIIAGCTTGANNGTFALVEIGEGGGNNFVIYNASGVAQTGAAGTAQPAIISYNFANPILSEFTAGELAYFAAHTDGGNNGNLLIYKINQAGNNIWVKNAVGVAQGTVNGSADVNRWKFALTAPASTIDYVVGETALMSAHTSGGNNGSFPITAVNLAGNNVTVYNSAGVAQGGAAGTVDTNRFKYVLPTDPSAQVTAGDTMQMSAHTDPLNDGVFTVKEVNNSAGTNVVVFNPSGVTQAGVAGLSETTRKLIKFAADQSAVYTTDSYIEMNGCAGALYNFNDIRAPYKVLQVNRGGGANYNVVIDVPLGEAQIGGAGYVILEMKSIFTSAPSIAPDVTGIKANQNLVGSSSAFVAGVIPAQTPLMVYVTNLPYGDPRDLTIILS